MFKYINKLLEDSKIFTYNYLNNNIETNKKYPKLLDLSNEDVEYANTEVDDKQLRINILLFIRQYKNTYYKYINKEKFNEELYNSFINEENFDGGNTAYDDEDNTRIFDKYILEYIKNRNSVMTYLQCKNKIINLKNNLEVLNDIKFSNDSIDVLFILDMSEKDIFSYCYNLLHNHGKISYIKDILFSIIFKYNNQQIRLKVESFKTNTNIHPYLILETLLSHF
jgi:hypothetical protein